MPEYYMNHTKFSGAGFPGGLRAFQTGAGILTRHSPPPQAARPRPAIDESRRLEVGAGPKGMRLKRGQARVPKGCDLRRFA